MEKMYKEKTNEKKTVDACEVTCVIYICDIGAK